MQKLPTVYGMKQTTCSTRELSEALEKNSKKYVSSGKGEKYPPVPEKSLIKQTNSKVENRYVPLPDTTAKTCKKSKDGESTFIESLKLPQKCIKTGTGDTSPPLPERTSRKLITSELLKKIPPVPKRIQNCKTPNIAAESPLLPKKTTETNISSNSGEGSPKVQRRALKIYTIPSTDKEFLVPQEKSNTINKGGKSPPVPQRYSEKYKTLNKAEKPPPLPEKSWKKQTSTKPEEKCVPLQDTTLNAQNKCISESKPPPLPEKLHRSSDTAYSDYRPPVPEKTWKTQNTYGIGVNLNTKSELNTVSNPSENSPANQTVHYKTQFRTLESSPDEPRTSFNKQTTSYVDAQTQTDSVCDEESDIACENTSSSSNMTGYQEPITGDPCTLLVNEKVSGRMTNEPNNSSHEMDSFGSYRCGVPYSENSSTVDEITPTLRSGGTAGVCLLRGNSNITANVLLVERCNSLQIGEQNIIQNNSDSVLKRIKEYTNHVLQHHNGRNYLQKDHIVSKSVKNLREKGICILKGCQNCGKTSYGVSILLELFDDFEDVLWLISAKDVMETVNINIDQLVFIDDIFGKTSYNVTEWEPYFDYFSTCLNGGKVKFILSCANSSFDKSIEVRNHYPFIFSQDIIVDLSALPHKNIHQCTKTLPLSEKQQSRLHLAVRNRNSSAVQNELQNSAYSLEDRKMAFHELSHLPFDASTKEILHLLIGAREIVNIFAETAAKSKYFDILFEILKSNFSDIDPFTLLRIFEIVIEKMDGHDEANIAAILKLLLGSKPNFLKTSYLEEVVSKKKRLLLQTLLQMHRWGRDELSHTMLQMVKRVPKEDFDIFDMIWQAGAPLQMHELLYVLKLEDYDLLEHMLQAKEWPKDDLSEAMFQSIKLSNQDDSKMQIFHLLNEYGLPASYRCFEEAARKTNVHILNYFLLKRNWETKALQTALEVIFKEMQTSLQDSKFLFRSKECIRLLERYGATLSETCMSYAKHIMNNSPDSLPESIKEQIVARCKREKKSTRRTVSLSALRKIVKSKK